MQKMSMEKSNALILDQLITNDIIVLLCIKTAKLSVNNGQKNQAVQLCCTFL